MSNRAHRKRIENASESWTQTINCLARHAVNLASCKGFVRGMQTGYQSYQSTGFSRFVSIQLLIDLGPFPFAQINLPHAFLSMSFVLIPIESRIHTSNVAYIRVRRVNNSNGVNSYVK